MGVEALQMPNRSRQADRSHAAPTEPAYCPFQRVAVNAVTVFVGDQDTYVAVTLTLVSESPHGGEDLLEGNVLGEHLVGTRPKHLLADPGILKGGHHQHRDGGVGLV